MTSVILSCLAKFWSTQMAFFINIWQRQEWPMLWWNTSISPGIIVCWALWSETSSPLVLIWGNLTAHCHTMSTCLILPDAAPWHRFSTTHPNTTWTVWTGCIMSNSFHDQSYFPMFNWTCGINSDVTSKPMFMSWILTPSQNSCKLTRFRKW